MKLGLSTQSYKSIGSSISAETKEKGSKFIGLAACVISEEDIKKVLDQWQTMHPTATHICYAYRLGIDGKIYRANDDGEPNNSAGAPILGQILSMDVTNTIVGVVRYYGGTKLGVGGLVQAYKNAAKEVLEASEIIEYELSDYFELTCDYEEMPLVMNLLKRNRIEIQESLMAESCTILIKMNLSETIDLSDLLAKYKSVTIKHVERK